MRKKWVWLSLLLLLIGEGFFSGVSGATPSSTPKEESLAQVVKDNNARLRYITSQILQIQDQTERILTILQTENSTLDPLVEKRLHQLQTQMDELKIQVQILGKALIALVAVLVLILILMIVRSRRPPRPGSIRI